MLDDFEVYNDKNGNLTALYRCVRDRPNELIEKLRYVLDSREDFCKIKEIFKEGKEQEELERAANFYQLVRYSYASACDSFASQPHDMWANFPLIKQAHRRLRKVIIENKDFEKLIGQYDRPVSFFYCDPPYFMTEDYYDDVGFTKKDHERLRDCLMSIQGKFLLSYNDCEFIRKLYDKPGIRIAPVTRLNNIKQRYEGGSEYPELLIANYDLNERKEKMPTQMSWEF